MSISVTYTKDGDITTLLYHNLGIAFDGVSVSKNGLLDLRKNGRWACSIMHTTETDEFIKQLADSGSPIKVEFE